MIQLKRHCTPAVVAALLLLSHTPVLAETVFVKYRGPVNIARMRCEAITGSSFVRRLCYDAQEQYVVVALNETYYHYCGVPRDVVARWRSADSIGGYYNSQIKGRFDCRQGHVPQY